MYLLMFCGIIQYDTIIAFIAPKSRSPYSRRYLPSTERLLEQPGLEQAFEGKDGFWPPDVPRQSIPQVGPACAKGAVTKLGPWPCPSQHYITRWPSNALPLHMHEIQVSWCSAMNHLEARQDHLELDSLFYWWPVELGWYDHIFWSWSRSWLHGSELPAEAPSRWLNRRWTGYSA